mgnify:CR=1 FL=1
MGNYKRWNRPKIFGGLTCGDVREAEYNKNYYEIENDESIEKFIEESELSESKYFCTRCGIKSSYTLE